MPSSSAGQLRLSNPHAHAHALAHARAHALALTPDPHPRLAARPDGRCHVYTSNVDGHFRRFAALGARLHEIHGCTEDWMCARLLA